MGIEGIQQMSKLLKLLKLLKTNDFLSKPTQDRPSVVTFYVTDVASKPHHSCK